MIVGHGIDLVECAALNALLADPAGHFLQRCFTESERAAAGADVNRVDRLAGRLAVKEAVMKALGTGFGDGVGFLHIEVSTLPTGAPTVALHGRAAEAAKAMGATRWLISISHAGGMAVGSAIAVAD